MSRQSILKTLRAMQKADSVDAAKCKARAVQAKNAGDDALAADCKKNAEIKGYAAHRLQYAIYEIERMKEKA